MEGIDVNAILAQVRNSPRYQRAVQRLAATPKHKRALVDTVLADEAFGGEGARRAVQNARAAAAREQDAWKLDFASRAHAQDMAEKEARLDFHKEQEAQAANLGKIELGAAGVLGALQIPKDLEREKTLRRIRDLYLAGAGPLNQAASATGD